jgi:hypothetical protein
MLIQVSKVFAKFINETANERNVKFCAEVVEISPDRYGFIVGDIAEAEQDYNPRTGKIKVMRVNYPVEYYCNPVFVSTADLVRNFRRFGVQDLNSLKDMLCDWFAV